MDCAFSGITRPSEMQSESLGLQVKVPPVPRIRVRGLNLENESRPEIRRLLAEHLFTFLRFRPGVCEGKRGWSRAMAMAMMSWRRSITPASHFGTLDRRAPHYFLVNNPVNSCFSSHSSTLNRQPIATITPVSF